MREGLTAARFYGLGTVFFESGKFAGDIIIATVIIIAHGIVRENETGRNVLDLADYAIASILFI